MPLIKHRPRIRLLVPTDSRAGEELSAEVVLDARHDVPIEGLTIELHGYEEVVYGSGKNRRVYRHPLCRLSATLAAAGVVAKGSHRHKCRIPLPPGLPPSCASSAGVAVKYEATVQASIAWWPDAKETFSLRVMPQEEEPPADEPYLFASAGGMVSTEPYLEARLETRAVRPGDVLRGAVALGNVAYNRYDALKVSLAAKISSRWRARGEYTVRRSERWEMRIPIPELHEGMTVPFELRIPPEIAPTFTGNLLGIGWEIELEAENQLLKRNPSLRADVRILPPPRGEQQERARRRLPPSIGAGRLQKIWEGVAVAHGLSLDDEGMRGSAGEVALAVRRDHRGPHGIWLLIELGYPSLHLALDGGVATGFRRIFGDDVELGIPSWDKAHYVTGRDRAQVAAFLHALGGLLAPVRVADLTDERMVLELRDAGMQASTLQRFIEQARALADAIPMARAAIPAPTGYEDALPAWRRLAGRVDGTLELTRLAVRGSHQGAPVELFIDWSPEGKPIRTVAALLTGAPIEEAHRITYRDGEPVEGDPARLPKAAAEAARAIAAEAAGLEIGEQRLALSVIGPLRDPTPLLPRLSALATLAALLHAPTGPYR